MRLKISTFILSMLLSFAAYGSDFLRIKGKVVDVKNGNPLAFVGIHVLESGEWTSSDAEGLFFIEVKANQNITISARCLGMAPFSKRFAPGEINQQALILSLTPITYDMKELTVLAISGKQMSTSYTINDAAIQHVQPTTLAEIMQLLPYNVISANPSLDEAQQISFREIGTDINSAMGASVIVDGATLSNNGNLQTYSTSRASDAFSTVAGAGLDLRQIATDNIESVEVIQGIPSVIYGNLTSGAVVVKTKTGAKPYDVKFKTAPKIKHLSFGKGYLLSSKGNVININIDYLQSFSDIRSKYGGYDRLTGGVKYSQVFFKRNKPLIFNVGLSLHQTLDEFKTDPDMMVAEELTRSRDKGGRFNLDGKWLIKSKWITNLNYHLSSSFANQTSEHNKYRTGNGIETISIATTEGQNAGVFLPSEQFTFLLVDGKPLSVYGQVYASKIFETNSKFANKLLYGFEYQLDANYGDGQIYDAANPPFSYSYSARPRKFSDIPALSSFAMFMEDNLKMDVGSTTLFVQGGVRLNNFQAKSPWENSIGIFIEPRFNLKLRIIDELNVNMGWGKTYKSAPLIYLYPDKAYFDLSMLNYYTGNPSTNLSIIDTRIFDTGNPDLKPAQNTKYEIGFDFHIRETSGKVTYFHERLANGFGFAPLYQFIAYDKYDSNSLPADQNLDVSQLTLIPSTAVMAYQQPVNNKESVKEGIEFNLNLGKIESLYTSISMDGAWLLTKRIMSTIPYQYQPSSATAEPYNYVGMYPSGEQRVSERLNTTVRLVTQIPSLRLILSTTAQITWFDKYYYSRYNEVPGYLFYADGGVQTFTNEMALLPEYIRFVNEHTDAYYLKEIMPVLFLFNYRLSKEIREKIKLSLYVNNFINQRPDYQSIRTGALVRRNPSVYFGAEVSFKF